MPKFFSALNTFVMGRRPYNTVFSFNYHNISHIVRFLKEIKPQLPVQQQVIADIGGGAAPYYEFFSDIASEYTVLDVENVLPKNDARKIKFIESFAESLPLESNSLDIVLSNQVLEHVISAEKAVSESFRVLKPGGFFIGSVPHISPIHLEPYDFRRFTELGLKKVLEDAGFTDIRITGNGGVFRAAALLVLMDATLSKMTPGKPQRVLTKKHFLMFPITGLVNTSAMVLDFLIGDKKRSPSNYCWIARKRQ